MFQLIPDGKIKVCYCDRKTPLLWTFKFPGAEWWCPACGYTEGMFGAGINIPSTPELEQSRKDWEEKAKNFLSSRNGEWTYIHKNGSNDHTGTTASGSHKDPAGTA